MNTNRVAGIIFGAFFSCVFGCATAPFWALADIDPTYWLIFVIWVCAPIGGFIGWRIAGRFS